MLSIDLFNSRYEKKLHEGAVDDAIAHLIEPLSQRAMDIRTQLRSRRLDPAQVSKLEKEYEELVQKRLDIILDRKTQTQEQQVPSKQDPFAYVKPEPKGVGDVQDPRQKMAQLAQRSKKGPLANVGAGLRAFIKGEPEPMDEEQQTVNPRALGVANFQRLVKANMGNIPIVSLEFIRPEENFKLDQKGLDLISDYYDGLESDQAKNYFIYRVLPSGDETKKILKQLGWTTQQVQPSLPGIPTQGELPLQEKKKSNSDDLEAGDVKVARELQKLRARYPAVRSDIEAVASAEIDSAERSRQQLAAIRGANEKQDALLKQLVDLDKQQGGEIDGLDQENNSLEQRLAQVQATNDRLQQAIGQMTGTKKAATKTKTTVPQVSADVAQGGIIDVGAPVSAEPVKQVAEPESKPIPTKSAMGSMARQLTKGFSSERPLDTIKPPPASMRKAALDGRKADNDGERKADNDGERKAAESKIKEHGGGIGPKQHWQDLMREGQPQELIHRYLAIDAENDVDAVRAAIQAISRDSALGANSKSRLLGQIGMIIKRHRLPIGRAYYQFMRQYMEAVELDRARVPEYPQDPATVKHRLDTAKAILSDPRMDADSRREAAAIVAKSDKPGVNETVENVRAGMAEIYRRLAPKIERHRDSFLAGQLYDELENYAELHGAEGEFKRMMATARNRAHMEYDTNPGGFQNWFWFLPFEDDSMTEGTDELKKKMSKLEALALAANRAGDDAKCKMYQQKIQSLKQKLSQSMSESLKPGEYYVHTVYFKDGTKKRIRVTSDEVDVADYYNKRGQAVDRVDYDFQLHSDMTEGLKSTLAGAALAGAMALGGAGAAQAQSASGGPNLANPTTIIQQIQSGKIQNQNDLASALGNASNKQAVFKILQNKAGLPGHGADSVINALSKKNATGAQQPATGAQATVKSAGQSGSIVQRPTDNFEGRIKEEFGMPGTTIPLKSVIQGYTVFFNPKTRSVSITRGGDSEEAAIEQARIGTPSMKNFRLAADRLITKIESDLNEAKEIVTKNDFLDRRDYLLRMISADSNSANKQIIKAEIRKLESQAEAEGWITMQQRMVREDSDGGEAVEMAIMRRMLVAHTDLIVEFGLDKVVQAIEEVAYNVGDTDEIGSSDVSGWVQQVKQILGVDA